MNIWKLVTFFKNYWKTNHLTWNNFILHDKIAFNALFKTSFKIILPLLEAEMCRFVIGVLA